MDKRSFIKASLLGLSTLQLPKLTLASPAPSSKKDFGYWFWVVPNKNAQEKDLYKKFKSWKDAGGIGVFIEDYDPKYFSAAKAAGLSAHRWMWTMNRGEQELLTKHPEYYAVSRSGKSCATHPAYVNYYRFLCPSHPDVPKYLADRAFEQLEKKDVDGLHLDYIRYPDVILPVNLWENYGIRQNSELPDYDFCYSPYSKEAFLKEYGINIDEVEYPDQSMSWRYFRYNQITKIVNNIAKIAHEHHKPLSAAVFPTPEIAKRIVRQDWANWDLSSVFPMIYHGFYREPVSWIGHAVQEGVQALHGKFPLYAGLYLPDFKSVSEIKTAVQLVKANGGAGISLFGENEVTPQVLEMLQELKNTL